MKLHVEQIPALTISSLKQMQRIHLEILEHTNDDEARFPLALFVSSMTAACANNCVFELIDEDGTIHAITVATVIHRPSSNECYIEDWYFSPEVEDVFRRMLHNEIHSRMIEAFDIHRVFTRIHIDCLEDESVGALLNMRTF